MIVALDCATETGFAVMNDAGALTDGGTQEFSLQRGESSGMRFRRFNLWLRSTFPELGTGDLVLFEQAHQRGGPATEIGVGMATRVMEWAAEFGADYKAVHSRTLKKCVTGKGNAGKPEMIEAVNAKLGMAVDNDNLADALGLVIWYRAGMPEGASKKKAPKAAKAREVAG